jgi:hypothetical protein
LCCRGLLRSTHQRAGLELMDQMSAHQESAYEHLCRYYSHVYTQTLSRKPLCVRENLSGMAHQEIA